MLVTHERVFLKSSSCIQKRHNQVCSTACAGVGFYDRVHFISIKLSTVSIPWVSSLEQTTIKLAGTRTSLKTKHDDTCLDIYLFCEKGKIFFFGLREVNMTCLVTLWQQFTCRFCDSSWIIFTFFSLCCTHIMQMAWQSEMRNWGWVVEPFGLCKPRWEVKHDLHMHIGPLLFNSF